MGTFYVIDLPKAQSTRLRGVGGGAKSGLPQTQLFFALGSGASVVFETLHGASRFFPQFFPIVNETECIFEIEACPVLAVEARG